jgi:hypothetical protein
MSEIQVNTINEYTGANGVNIDGVLIKDGEVDGVDVSAITQGITEADEWNLTANFTTAGSNDITSNLSRPTGTLQSYMGTGMTQSSGIFTFPSTGYWLVTASAYIQATTSDGATLDIMSTNDNFTSEDLIATMVIGLFNSGNIDNSTGFCSTIIDVTDTSNHKIKFRAGSITSGTVIAGSANHSLTSFKFLKLGDT